MQPITQIKKIHAHWDALGGVILKDGEAIQIKWPDGTLEPIVVMVKAKRCALNVTHEAYYVTKYHGRDTWVRLLGLNAVRI